jgi:hypothetical protein
MELAGKVIAVLEPRGGVSKTGNEWKVQEYVIETHDQYPKKMCFDVFGADKIAQFNIQAGEELNVFFDVDAREWSLVQQYPCVESRACGCPGTCCTGCSVSSHECCSRCTGRFCRDRREG